MTQTQILESEPLNVVLSLRLSKHEAQRAKELAAKDMRPVSQWMRVQLVKVLQEDGNGTGVD